MNSPFRASNNFIPLCCSQWQCMLKETPNTYRFVTLYTDDFAYYIGPSPTTQGNLQ